MNGTTHFRDLADARSAWLNGNTTAWNEYAARAKEAACQVPLFEVRQRPATSAGLADPRLVIMPRLN